MMDLDNRIKTFEGLATSWIDREGLSDLLDMLRKTDFYYAPASTKYHESYEGGLVEHSLNVFDQLWGDVWETDISKESITIVALFHDICKIGFYKESTRNTKDDKGKWIQVPYYEIDDKLPLGHSEKSIIMLQQYMKLTDDEIFAINSHMGGFDKRAGGFDDIIGKTFVICPLAVYLHIADMKATYLKG